MDSDAEFRVVEEVRKVFSKTAVPIVYALIENVTRLGDEDNVQTATQKICNFLLESGGLYDTQENDLAENEAKCVENISSYIADSAESNSKNIPKIEQTATVSSQPPMKTIESKNLPKVEQTATVSSQPLMKIIESKIPELTACSNENKDPNTLSTDNAVFECACCFNDTPLTTMVQCSEGHLFCSECLEHYTQESVYGQGKCTLICMSEDCGVAFPKSQLSLALPADLFKKYEERITLESINSAGLENFVTCKFCNYGAELDSDAQYFSCTQCEKIFCRKCQELYDNHRGLSCEEIEKNAEKDIRKSYEERMTEAKIRTCSKCKSRFTKGSGCNKISCRCLTTMCYVCRQPNVKYDHFCQHERLNGQKCNSCDRPCYLWSNADEDDQMAIEELRKQANDARVQEGFTHERVIGAPNLPDTISRAQSQHLFEDNDDDGEFTDSSDEYNEHYSDENENLDQENSDSDEWDAVALPPIAAVAPPPQPVMEQDEDEWYDVLNNDPGNMSEDDDSSNYADVEDYLEVEPTAYDFPDEGQVAQEVEDYASEEDLVAGEIEDYASEGDLMDGEVEVYASEVDLVAGEVEVYASEEDHVAGEVEDYASEEDHGAKGEFQDYASEGGSNYNDYDNYHDDYEDYGHDHQYYDPDHVTDEYDNHDYLPNEYDNQDDINF